MRLLSLETDDADKGKILLDEEESTVVEPAEVIGEWRYNSHFMLSVSGNFNF